MSDDHTIVVVEIKLDEHTPLTVEVRIPKDIVAEAKPEDLIDLVLGRVKLDWMEFVANGYSTEGM